MYTSLDKVRGISGLSTTDISDANLTITINLTEKNIDSQPDVTLTDSLKEQASTFKSASVALLQSVGSLGTGDYSLGGLRVSKKSLGSLRQGLALSFDKMFKETLALGTDGTAIRKISD